MSKQFTALLESDSSASCFSDSGSVDLTRASLRRTSLLSQSMIDNEVISIYDMYTFSRHNSSYHVISLKESQGFLFNQDLFASAYQQLRTLLRERQVRELSSRKRSKSHGGPTGVLFSLASMGRSQQRRHTTYSSGPLLQIIGGDSAIDEGSSDEMCIDEFSAGRGRSADEPPATLPKAMSFSEPTRERPITSGFDGIQNGTARDSNMDFGFDEESDHLDGYELDSGPGFTPIGSNYVPVIDIFVDDMDHIPDV